MKEKWYFIVSAVLAVIFVLKGFFEGRDRNEMLDSFRDELQRRVRIKRKEAIDDAEEKHEHSVDSSIDDWMDDQLGSDRESS